MAEMDDSKPEASWKVSIISSIVISIVISIITS